MVQFVKQYYQQQNTILFRLELMDVNSCAAQDVFMSMETPRAFSCLDWIFLPCFFRSFILRFIVILRSSSFLFSITPLPYTPFSSSHDCNRRHTTLHWTSLPLLFITFHSRNQRSNCHSSTLRSIVRHSSHDILNTDSSSDSVLTMDKISHFHRFKKSILAFWKFQEKIRSELDELSIRNFNKMQVILRDLEIYFILFYGW